MAQEPHRLVFIDETTSTTKMVRLHGRCRKGGRLHAKAPFGHGKTQTFIAGLRCWGMTAPFVIDAPMNRAIFEAYVETPLAPTLAKGDVVILDNLAAHKSPKAEAAIKARGAWMLFLPPYSPVLNPIKMAFSKLKACLRTKATRTIDQLRRAIGDICALYSPTECPNDFKAAGSGPIWASEALDTSRKNWFPAKPAYRRSSGHCDRMEFCCVSCLAHASGRDSGGDVRRVAGTDAGQWCHGIVDQHAEGNTRSMLGIALAMIGQCLNDAAIADPAVAAFRNHARQFGPEGR